MSAVSGNFRTKSTEANAVFNPLKNRHQPLYIATYYGDAEIAHILLECDTSPAVL